MSFIVVLIDQLLKIFLASSIATNGDIVIIKNIFSLTYLENTGAAWGNLSGSGWFLIIMSLFAVYAIIKYFLLDVNITKIELVSYGLLLGGIVGNLIDRVIHGYVIDFINLEFLPYQFPIFNIADSAIVIGSILIIYSLMKPASIRSKQGRNK